MNLYMKYLGAKEGMSNLIHYLILKYLTTKVQRLKHIRILYVY